MKSFVFESGLRPGLVIPPGESLYREIKARKWTQREFAEIVGRPYQMVNEIIHGKKSITPDISREISAAFGTSPEFWYRLQSRYDVWLADTPEAKRKAKAIAKRAAESRKKLERQYSARESKAA